MIFQWFAKYADAVSRVQGRDDDAVALFVDESCGKALIASAAGRTERVEANCVDCLNAFFQAVLYIDQIFFEIGAEFLERFDAVRQAGDGVADRSGVFVRQKLFQFYMKERHIAGQCKHEGAEDDEGYCVWGKGNAHVVDYSMPETCNI